MLRFSKGSKPKDPVRTPDTLITADTIEILLGVSEGPIKGLVDGPKTFYIDNTALLNHNGEPNFSSFALQFWPGNEEGHEVKMELGGFSNPINVGVELAQGVPVVRSGITTNIDAIDFRVVVHQLLKQNNEGVFTAPLSLKFEIKKTTDSTWRPAWISDVSNDVPEIGSSDSLIWRHFGEPTQAVPTFAGDALISSSTTNPSVPPAATGPQVIRHINTTDGSVWAWGNQTQTWQQQSIVDENPTAGYKVTDDGRRFYNTSTAPVGARVGDLWWKGGLTTFYVWNGSQWVASDQYQASAAPVIQDGVWTIDEKVTSATAKDLRVFVEPDPDARWEFRVTKLSQDTDTEIQSVVVWEGVQEIKRAPMTFKGLSMIRVIGKASDQFTALPQWSADMDGREVKVASNYDPETRTYNGIWDGTYKIAWTNNPAWIFQDFVENTRYGLSAIFPHTVNKWRIYEWARWCDVRIDNPDGSTRPRWTFNDYFREPRDAKEMAQYIAGAAGAMYVDDGNGQVDVIIDKDAPAVALFTAENVGEEGFTYSYTDRLTRTNQVIVEFINPFLNWERDKRVVQMESDIEKVGVISENFIAVGCTDENEALARARRRLIGSLTEKEMVTFTTNRQGRFLSEWDVILICDDEMGRGESGRIKEKLSYNSVSLRDPITLDPGIDYEATFTVVNPDYPNDAHEPFTTVTLPITSPAGTHTTLTFGGALPTNLPEKAVFAISAAGHIGMPKPYRITGIEDEGGSGEYIRITALELNRNKYTYIDTGIYDGDIDYGSGGEVQPPQNLRVITEIKQRGTVSHRVATLMWDRSPSPFVRAYEITWYVDGVQKPSPAPVTGLKCEFEPIMDGDHVFSVVAVDLFGRRSKSAVIRYNTNGVFPVNGQFNFRLINGVTPERFEVLEPTFAWDDLRTIPNFDHWEIVVFHPDLELPVRIENVGTQLTWTYKYEQNKADHAGLPPRQLQIGLRAVDQYGNSSEPDILNIQNLPPPPPSNLRAVVDGDGLLLSWSTIPAIGDFGGSRIYIDTTPGVTPSDATKAFEGPGNQARIPLVFAANYSILVGHYDLYRPDETVFGDEINQNIDRLAKELIEDLDEVVEQVQEVQQEIDQKIAEVQGVIDANEQLAEDIISARLATIEEIAKREELTFFEGTEIGTIAHNALTKVDDAIDQLSLIGGRSENGEGFILDLDRIQLNENETITERLGHIEARFGGTSSSQLLTQITATASDAHAALDTLSLMGVAFGEGANRVFVLNTNKLRVSGTETLFQRMEQIDLKFGGSSRTALLDMIDAAADEASVAMTRTAAMGAWNANNSSIILDMNKVKASPTETLAERLSGLVVTDGHIDARADSRILISLGPGGPIATSISSVQSTANNAQSMAALAMSALNGNDASIAMLTQVNGKITGLRIGGANGDFGILANKFVLVDPNGGNPIVPFVYSSGVVYMPNVLVDKIVGGAVTTITHQQFHGQTSGSMVHSTTFGSAPHLVQLMFNYSPAGNGMVGVRVDVYRDGIPVGWGAAKTDNLFPMTVPIYFVDVPGGLNGAPHTYSFVASTTPGSQVGITPNNCWFSVSELKK